MDFGNILDEWDKREALEKKRQPQTKGGEGVPAPVKPVVQKVDEATEYKETMVAYLNRHGVPDKDAELDADAERERLESSADFAEMRPEASIDLHGLVAAEAERRLKLFLESSRRRGLSKILIIHGKGNHSEEGPVLGAAVRRVLDECDYAGRRGIPERRLGGKGAIWVILRRKND
jgi:DNA-nicking Smr family endonuclease